MMEKEYKIRISLKLRDDCINLFKECDEFKSPEKLRAFVNVTELELILDLIPASETLDHDKLFNDLLTTRKSSSEPVLLDLLDALAQHYKGLMGDKFREISALLQAGKTDQDKDYRQVVNDGAPTDGRGAEESAMQWIEAAGDDLDEMALRITLAVFNGTPYETIERAKTELLEMLKEIMPPPPPPDPEKPPPFIPHIPIMQRLNKAGATEAEGKPPDWQRVIELESPQLASEAIVYVWQLNRETKWRKKLIEWLTNHVARRSSEVRTRAAVAVGRLAVKDYRFVRDELLTKWVRRNDPKFRTAIGMALGVLVREEPLKAEVQNLLREWAGSDEADKRWAAMRAYIYVGAYCQPPGEVIARWRKVAASEPVSIDIPISEHEVLRLNNALHMSLMDAMVRFSSGVAQLPDEERLPLVIGILGELKQWIAEDDGAGLGLFMFTMLGQLVVNANGDGESAPVLLQLVEEGAEKTEYRARLAELFGVAMSSGATVIEAKELLCAWLDWANGVQGNSELYEARIRTVFKDIIADDKSGRIRGRLAACLRDCGRNRTAQSILSSL